MHIALRTVIFQKVVVIENVPVCSCETCDIQEVLPAIKAEVTDLIRSFGSEPERRTIYFDQTSELAHLLILACDKQQQGRPVQDIVRERVNELLDMMLLARSLNDAEWRKDLERRLRQISQYGNLSSLVS